MFALDLFNNDHERRLAEGAVDQLEQRRIDDLAMRMDDLVARAKTAATPAVKQALMKEFQKCRAERDSYYKIKDECMGYGGLTSEAGIPGNVPAEKIPGKEDLLKGRGRGYYEGADGQSSKRKFPDPRKPYVKNGKTIGAILPNGKIYPLSKSDTVGDNGMIYHFQDPRAHGQKKIDEITADQLNALQGEQERRMLGNIFGADPDEITQQNRIRQQDREYALGAGTEKRLELKRKADEIAEIKREKLRNERVEDEENAFRRAETVAQRQAEMEKIRRAYEHELSVINTEHRNNMEVVKTGNSHEINKLNMEYAQANRDRDEKRGERDKDRRHERDIERGKRDSEEYAARQAAQAANNDGGGAQSAPAGQSSPRPAGNNVVPGGARPVQSRPMRDMGRAQEVRPGLGNSSAPRLTKESQKKKSETVDEGQMGKIDAQRQDLERMNERQFYTAYGMSKAAFQQKYRTLLKPALDEEEYDTRNNPWHVTDVDTVSETDFEVALQGPDNKQLNFIIRPIDFIEQQTQRFQIDSMDVRDLQTGKTFHVWSGDNMGSWIYIFDAIDTYFWMSPPLQKQLRKIIDYYMDAGEQGKSPDKIPGLDDRPLHSVGSSNAIPADRFVKARQDMKKVTGQDINEGQGLHAGDPIVVTAPNEFAGKTGEIYQLSPSGAFVIVDLYNHGKHSMHLSDVKYNDYADQEEADDWYDESVAEGFQDFNKVEPYAVCLAGKPVKKFDYYEEARRFHDNWKQKLYREGNQAKADKITLMPLNLDESVEDYSSIYSPEAIALGKIFCDHYNITDDGDIQLAVEIIDSYLDEFKANNTPVDLKKIKSGVADAFRQVYRGMGPGPTFRKKFQEQGVAEDSQLNEYIVRSGDDIGSVLSLNLFADLLGQGNLSDYDEEFANSAKWQAVVAKWAPKAEYLQREIAKYQNTGRKLRDAEADALDATAYDGSDAYDNADMAAQYLPKVYNKQAAAIVRLLKDGYANPPAGMHEDAAVLEDAGSWIVYDPETKQIKKRFKTHTAGKSYAKVHNLGFASSEYYFDKVKDQSAVAEVAPPGARAERMVKHIKKSLSKDGKLSDKDKAIAYATTWKAHTAGKVEETQTDYQKRRQRERDVDAGRPVKPMPKNPRTDYQKRRAEQKRQEELGEDQDNSGVEQAIIRRIMVAHTDLLMQFGPEKVIQAAEEVAYNVGAVDEIGTSDVSAYVDQVRQILGVEA
jgi:hypothetical protein